jgi:hypothetical protein
MDATAPQRGNGRASRLVAQINFLISQELSTPIETRHSRHLWLKLLIWLTRSMSGSPNFPTCYPTKSDQKPDKSEA